MITNVLCFWCTRAMVIGTDYNIKVVNIALRHWVKFIRTNWFTGIGTCSKFDLFHGKRTHQYCTRANKNQYFARDTTIDILPFSYNTIFNTFNCHHQLRSSFRGPIGVPLALAYDSLLIEPPIPAVVINIIFAKPTFVTLRKSFQKTNYGPLLKRLNDWVRPWTSNNLV